jgi:hypothetical protein
MIQDYFAQMNGRIIKNNLRHYVKNDTLEVTDNEFTALGGLARNLGFSRKDIIAASDKADYDLVGDVIASARFDMGVDEFLKSKQICMTYARLERSLYQLAEQRSVLKDEIKNLVPVPAKV